MKTGLRRMMMRTVPIVLPLILFACDLEQDADCAVCATTSECTSALGTGWACVDECCVDLAGDSDGGNGGGESGDDDAGGGGPVGSGDDDSGTPPDPKCTAAVNALNDTCGLTLIDRYTERLGKPELLEWCAASQEFMTEHGVAESPYWAGIYECSANQECSDECYLDLATPAGPATGCGHTVDLVYACRIFWTYDEVGAQRSRYPIPEIEMLAACDVTTELPWDCYETCVETNPCTMLAYEWEVDRLLDCLLLCEESHEEETR